MNKPGGLHASDSSSSLPCPLPHTPGGVPAADGHRGTNDTKMFDYFNNNHNNNHNNESVNWNNKTKGTAVSDQRGAFASSHRNTMKMCFKGGLQ